MASSNGSYDKSFRVDGKVALVTGGARGLGAEICRALASGGAAVLVTDLSIPNWKDEEDNFLQRVWGVLVGVTAKIFRNHPKDRFATRVDFAGSFDNPDYSVWEIIRQVLRNTFVKAIPAKLEGDVSLGEAEKQTGIEVREAHGDEAEKRNTAADSVKRRVAAKQARGEGHPAEEGT